MNYCKRNIAIQWHITENCQLNCRHCYMGEKNYKECSYSNIALILEDVLGFAEKYNYECEFYITGGDPILHAEWEHILALFRENNCSFSIMCNPNSITEYSTQMLKKYGVKSVQFSIDGMQSNHNWMRGDGNFELIAQAVNQLKGADINTALMFTLFDFNKDDLLLAMNYASEIKVDRFSFDVGIDIGNAQTNGLFMIDEDVLEDILNAYIDEKERIKSKNKNIFFEEKCNLLNRLRMQKGHFGCASSENNILIFDGCQIGFSSFVIDVNGDFLGCRRLIDSNCGNLLNESLENIWFNSPFLKKQRRKIINKEICNCCISNKWCQGCEAYEIAKSIQSGKTRKTICGKIIGDKKDEFLDYNILTGNYLSVIESETFKKFYLKLLLEPDLQKELLSDYLCFAENYMVDFSLVRPAYWLFVHRIKM